MLIIEIETQRTYAHNAPTRPRNRFRNTMMQKRYRKKPAPDDGFPVPPGHMRCVVWDHEGPRILPATLEYFRGRNSNPGGIDAVCRACRRRERKRRWWEVEKPQTKGYTTRKSISGNVLLILRGPARGVPLRLPRGTMVCSSCFRLLPHNRKYFDPTKNYRVEPVCLDCQNWPMKNQP